MVFFILCQCTLVKFKINFYFKNILKFNKRTTHCYNIITNYYLSSHLITIPLNYENVIVYNGTKNKK